ncbi:MAG TPA: hypothetical protein VMR41_04130 [Patescibacteria group bacterium]|jgi:hypothetical protein|nr:hypothetical protein [Patescibacteria group bacterium]
MKIFVLKNYKCQCKSGLVDSPKGTGVMNFILYLRRELGHCPIMHVLLKDKRAKRPKLTALFVFMIYSFSFGQSLLFNDVDAFGDTCGIYYGPYYSSDSLNVNQAGLAFHQGLLSQNPKIYNQVLDVQDNNGDGKSFTVYYLMLNLNEDHDCNCSNTEQSSSTPTVPYIVVQLHCGNGGGQSNKLTDSHMSIFMWFFCGLICGGLFCWGVFFNK